MNRKDIIIRNWEATTDTEGWFAPLSKALEGCSEKAADRKPAGNSSNSIREILCHLTYYKKRFLHRLEGIEFTHLDTNEATFDPDLSGFSDWQSLMVAHEDINRKIKQHLEAIEDKKLDTPLPDQPIGAQVMDLILHDAYHTGQIVALRKAQDSW